MPAVPIVSIVIPVFNRENLLVETLESLRFQTFEQWEALVVDDRSSDNSLRVAENHAREDERIRVWPREGETANGNVCRNQGLGRAKGKYVIFLDSDDLLSESCLEERTATMEEHPYLDFAVFGCIGFSKVMGDSEKRFGAGSHEDDLERLLRLDWAWQTGAAMWRRTSLGRVGPWLESLKARQDWEFSVRSLLMGLSYKRFDNLGFHYFRVTGNRLSDSHSQSFYVEQTLLGLEHLLTLPTDQVETRMPKAKDALIGVARGSLSSGRASRTLFPLIKQSRMFVAKGMLTNPGWGHFAFWCILLSVVPLAREIRSKIRVAVRNIRMKTS